MHMLLSRVVGTVSFKDHSSLSKDAFEFERGQYYNCCTVLDQKKHFFRARHSIFSRLIECHLVSTG